MKNESITLQVSPKQLQLIQRALGMAEEVAIQQASKYAARHADSYQNEERKVMLASLVGTYEKQSDNFSAMSKQLQEYR